MILNEDELRVNKETLDKYKEKLIDYEFSYAPRPFELLEILQDKLTAFKEYPLQDYLTKHKINNIRVISRIINALNDFSFIESIGKKSIFLFDGILINFHPSLSFDKGTHSLFCNWVKNTSKLGKSN
jgi:hypothetical protein